MSVCPRPTSAAATEGLFPLSDLTGAPSGAAQPPPRRAKSGGRARGGRPVPTNEQQVVVDCLRAGENTVVQARAGTGKTTTLVMATEEQRGIGILYLAYNKDIAVAARKKFGRHVKCRTLHSLAYAYAPAWVRERLNSPRQHGGMVAGILNITQPLVVSKGTFDMPIDVRLQPRHIARLAIETVRRFCYSSDTDIDWWHVPRQQGFTEPAQWQLARYMLPYAQRAWEDILHPQGFLRYEHDFYLKNWALDEPALPYDLVLLDEGQDSNRLASHLIAAQRETQTAIIGDSEQQLYKWRGARDSLAQFSDHKTLYLTQSFRFGRQIAWAGNVFLDLLDAAPPVRGHPEMNSRVVSDMDTPDAILCRTNGGAMEQVIDQLAAGRPVVLQGGGDVIKRMAQACIELDASQGTNHPELCAFRTWSEVREYAENDPSGQDLRAFVRLVDTHGPEQVIAACDRLVNAPSVTSADGARGRLLNPQTGQRQRPVVISTMHKSKGLEWDKVRIAPDAPTPRYDAATGERCPIDPAEWMLAYVAVTRARQELDPGPLRQWWEPPPAPVVPQAQQPAGWSG